MWMWLYVQTSLLIQLNNLKYVSTELQFTSIKGYVGGASWSICSFNVEGNHIYLTLNHTCSKFRILETSDMRRTHSRIMGLDSPKISKSFI